jgi:hypothetical protein
MSAKLRVPRRIGKTCTTGVRHNFTGGSVYELPFGKGRAFGNDWHPLLNGVLGNWQLGGLLYLRSGFAMTIRANDQGGGDGNDGPQTVGPVPFPASPNVPRAGTA